MKAVKLTDRTTIVDVGCGLGRWPSASPGKPRGPRTSGWIQESSSGVLEGYVQRGTALPCPHSTSKTNYNPDGRKIGGTSGARADADADVVSSGRVHQHGPSNAI